MNDATFALQAEGIGMAFGGVAALSDVTLEVPAGSWTGLIGPNGSGKTTMLNVLSGLYVPQSGRIVLEGVDVTAEAPARRGRRGVIRTFQHPQLAESMTIAENVQLGQSLARARGLEAGGGRAVQKRLDAEGLEATLDLFGCLQYAGGLPSEVPYGVRKMTEIARGVSAKPVVLLLDEPAAGLSREERGELVASLTRFAEQQSSVSVVLVEHDVRLVAQLCPRLVVLDAGKRIAVGETEEVLADKAVGEAYLGNKGNQNLLRKDNA